MVVSHLKGLWLRGKEGSSQTARFLVFISQFGQMERKWRRPKWRGCIGVTDTLACVWSANGAHLLHERKLQAVCPRVRLDRIVPGKSKICKRGTARRNSRLIASSAAGTRAVR